MRFFYHGEPGAWYFLILVAVCALAIWRGGNPRLFASCVVAVFLCDRVLLALTDGPWMMVWGGFAEFGALCVIYAHADSLAARVMMFLFSAKIAMYIALNLNGISFGTMAAWTEFAGYGQLLLILGVTLHDYWNKSGKYFRAVRSRIGGLLHSRKGEI